MAAPHPSLIELAAGRVAPEPADVGAFYKSATAHHMQGMVWSAVQRGELQLDSDARARLVQSDLTTRLWQEKLHEALRQIRSRLEAIDVEVAVFKGIANADRWYPRPAERPCIDLDVFVGPEAHARSAQIVEAIDPGNDLRPALPGIVERGLLTSVEARFQDAVWVDVHFDLLKLGLPSRGGLRYSARAHPLELSDGQRATVLDAETALLHAVVTLNRDDFAQLIGYADVARILQHETIDWNAFRDLVATEGLEVPVSMSLDAVVTTLDLPKPPLATPGGARSAVWRRVWPDRVRLTGDIGAAHHSNRTRVMAFLLRGRTLEALAALRWALFPPAALTELYFPKAKGGYLRRITLGRWQQWRGRRRARVARPQGVAPGPDADPAATRADD